VKRRIIGAIVGAVLGLAYYKFIGCLSGSCPIGSNWWASMAYGVIMGMIVASYVVKKK